MRSATLRFHGPYLSGDMERGNSKRDDDEDYAYYAEIVDAWVYSDNTFGHQAYDQRDPAHTPCPPSPRNVYQLERVLHGLNSLLLAHDAPISPPALDTVLEVLWQSQPFAIHAACRALPSTAPSCEGSMSKKPTWCLAS